ncbi:septation ring formation regulator EzrA [Lactobacillus helveticus]|jgi:septation ring formation regulator|uniref:Septation ring formation regulator EzrA n=2 Tax=Lactobacillus helveticus TaxID=1587 RepID=A0A1B2INV8_LACHE|nr:septation ring formation regulator EzrA [Lactobacillus helveticus]ADX70532.1 Septation ring formation regulator [Lactobacillus helveticus H10]AGQ23320.1 septation ring formation regulator protein EzrA [Lactobacillus helveticus CNRZ32]AHI11686.1 Septation ring formation regulator [Lactobacillus helveticus H9]ALI52850.1 septation ring formation regulator EzrA [Lactobacillus helveticus]ANZ55151.1 septation ring formation regulator EzrA [Lactobacillus helveticus]
MSSIQTIIIVAVVILIIVVVASMLLINRKQLREVEVIDAALNEIEEMHLEEDIKRLNKMDLAGESLTTLNTWRKSYKEASTKKLPRVQKLVEEAANENATYKLFKARKKIKEAQQIIKPALEDARNTKAVFTELLESNKENQIQYDALIKVYRELRKDVLANSFEYGAAIDQIEDQLASMESDFEEAKNLSSQGDHVEAKRVLSKIRMSLAALQKQLPKIKEGYHQLEVVFQDQLKELSNVYKKMISEKYYITKVDVLSRIKDIHDQIDSARKLLSELKVDELANENKKISSEIDGLYDVLAKEYKARPFVEKNQSKMLALISHQQTASKKLVEKLQHIDESYELTHGELEKSKELEKEVNNMNRQYTVDTQNIADGKGVYSAIQDSWLEMLDRLREIDAEQVKMSTDVDGLYDSENVANDSIKHFRQEVSLVYRRLERRSLPGNPDSFIQMYTLVVNEIGHVSDELSQVRINMEKISNELIQISDDVERLKREADDIINSANLVELTMQYSNKYADKDSIKQAQKKAMQLYDEYNYKEALDTIATAIEKAEPGSYQRLENTYYSEQKE